MQSLPGEEFLGDCEQIFGIAIDEFEFSLADFDLSPFGARFASIQGKLNKPVAPFQFVRGPRYVGFE
ncbi:MAG: hypothetical protein WCC41_17000 [Rhodomicrobium sp.]